MTTTYDPNHPDYLDEADVRGEMARAHDLCNGCRRCVDLCPSFPTLFELLDRSPGADAASLTPAEQDQVVDGCFQCKLCALGCPYGPGRHEADLDVPRLMLRAEAMRRVNGHHSLRSRRTTAVLGRTDRFGRLGTALAPVANRIVAAPPRSAVRRLVSAVTGVSAQRLLPPYARQRFSTWFRSRDGSTGTGGAVSQGAVTVYPTCVVEYSAPEIGHDLVKVYERNGFECRLSRARCCGAPWLHAGDVPRFVEVAARNVAALAAEVRDGSDIVVAQPTCSYVLKHDYPAYVDGADAQLVSAHTFDAAEYLVRLHADDATRLDTRFDGEVPSTVTYHAPCHLHAQDIGHPARALLELTGAQVSVVQRCSGIDGTWGLRSGREHLSLPIAQGLADHLDEIGSDVVVGDCHLANTAVAERSGQGGITAVPLHPLQLLARVYGIEPERPSGLGSP